MVVALHSEMSYFNENEPTTAACDNMDESQTYTMDGKKPDTKEQACLLPFIQRFKTGKAKLWSG